MVSLSMSFPVQKMEDDITARLRPLSLHPHTLSFTEQIMTTKALPWKFYFMAKKEKESGLPVETLV